MKSIKEGKKSGAKVVTGGGRHRDNGYFIQPTIFRDVRTKYTKSNNQAAEDSNIMNVESFGPIGEVNSFSTEEEVLGKANDTEYGLYGSIFTKNI